MANLEKLFFRNGYSCDLFQQCVNKFVSKKVTETSTLPVNEDSVDRLISIPYVGQPSIIYGRKICQLFKKYYNINIRVIYNTCKVRNYFSLKCATPFFLRANVVYKYTCLHDADITYIGKTKRHLAIRMKEHVEAFDDF